MHSTQMQEMSRLTQPNNQGNIQGQSQQNQDQTPNRNELDSRGQNRPSLTPRQEITPTLISGLYGFCLGNAVAALRDSNDGLTTGAGIVLLSIAGLYALTGLGSTFRAACSNEMPYTVRGAVKHGGVFLLCVASASTTMSRGFCRP